jgi:hypothetical protein
VEPEASPVRRKREQKINSVDKVKRNKMSWLAECYREENRAAGHKYNCAYGAGADCTCGKWEQEEEQAPIKKYTDLRKLRNRLENIKIKHDEENKDDIPF